jgi:hypothetical protein
MAAFLRQRCVVNDKISGLVPHKTVGFFQENSLKRGAFPHAFSNKMMELVITKLAIARRHRLDTLAVTRADQTRNVRRAQPHSGFMPQSQEEWLQPFLQIATPVFYHHQPPRKLVSYESGKSPQGNRKIQIMPK